MPFPPQHCGTQFGNGGKLMHQVIAHFIERITGIDHIIDQQHTPFQSTASNSDELRNIELPLLGTSSFSVATGGQNTQRQIVNTGKNIADTNAATSKAQNLVELPARFVHFQSQSLDQRMVIVPANPKDAISTWRQVHW